MSTDSLGGGGSNLSIMIPTYNCAEYLRHALASLLQQPPGTLEQAEIVVVDDCSTSDDPEAVLSEVALPNIRFYRRQSNGGPCPTFNTCLELAAREWIHILHADDYMLPGAYQEFATCIGEFRDALALFARAQIVTSTGEQLRESPLIGPAERDWLRYEPLMWSENRIYPCGVLLHRRAVDAVGHFDCTFSHVNDWNYWWRLAQTGRCVYSRALVGGYRAHESGHSSALVRGGRNVTEGVEQVERVLDSLGEARPSDTGDYYEWVFSISLTQCRQFCGDPEAFGANWRALLRMPRRFRWRKRRELAEVRLKHYRALLSRRLRK